jgi:RHS repeat-associated protein
MIWNMKTLILSTIVAILSWPFCAYSAQIETPIARTVPFRFFGWNHSGFPFYATVNGVSTGIAPWSNSPPQYTPLYGLVPHSTTDVITVYLEPNKTYRASITMADSSKTTVWCGASAIEDCIVWYNNGYGEDGANYTEFDITSWVVSQPLIRLGLQRENGVYTMSSANGTQAVAEAPYSFVPPLTWSIVEASPADLNCSISTNGVITAGGSAGTITIKVEDSMGCYAVETIELAGCDSGCGSTTGSHPGSKSPNWKGPAPVNDGESCGGSGPLIPRLLQITPKGTENDWWLRADMVLGNYNAHFKSGNASLTLSQGMGGLTLRQALGHFFNRRNVELVRTMGSGMSPVQIRSPESFLHTVSNSATKMTYEFYSFTNVSSAKGGNGLYSVSNSPHSTVAMEQVGGDTNAVRITRTFGGSTTETIDYLFLTNGLMMSQGNGARIEVGTTDWFETNTLRLSTHTISNASGQILFRKTQKIRRFTWGDGVVEEVVGTGSDTHTNSRSFTATGRVLTVTNDNGSWEHFLYDSEGRVSKKLMSYLNQSFTTNESLCRVFEYDYATNVVSGSGDAGVEGAGLPRQTTERILGQEVARQYAVYLPGLRLDIQCTSSGAAWNAGGNLIATNRFYTSGVYEGFVQSITAPDKTISAYHYGLDATRTTNVVLHGQPDSSGTNISIGTKAVQIFGPSGRLLEDYTYDVYPSRGDILLSSSVHEYDGLNRLTNTTYLDGTTTAAAYDCCHLGSTKNKDGTVTSYTYDALKRLLTTTANGVTHSNTYDAAGSIVKVERIGSDNSIIVVQRSAYDTAGHPTATTNALDQITLFAEAHGLSGTTNITTRLTNSSSGPQRIEGRYLDGQSKSITGGLAHPVRYEYGVHSGGTFTKEIKLDASLTDTSEVTTNFFDLLGRPYKTLYADGAFSQTFYNDLGQVSKEVDPDGVTTLYQYNSKGERSFMVLDVNRDGTIDWAGTDRITWTTNYVANNGVADVHRSETRVWMTNGTDSATLVSVQESAVNGLLNWSASFGLTNRSETAYPGGGVRYSRSFAPDGTFTTTRFENGLVTASTRTNGGTQLSSTTFGYDAHNRQKFITDARNGTTTNSFDNMDRVVARSTPTPGNGDSSQRTSYQFDTLGQVIAVTNSDNTLTYFASQATGERTKTWGAREYPVEQTYTAQGRMATMKTWQDFAGNAGTATTTWNYDSARGWLASKRYADNLGPDYAYTPAGRLRQRTWARGTTTTYTTNALGEVERLTYSDGTGSETNTYDRRGRVTTLHSGTNVTTRLYSEAGLLLSETQNGLVVSNRYDELLRRTNVAVVVGGTLVASTGYGYDSAGRLATVTDGTNRATYSYVANSPLISELLFQQNATTRMTTSKSYDYLNRLLLITNQVAAAGAESPSFAYALNAANQRTAITNENAAHWLYGYDTLGQVTSGTKRWSDGTAVLGQQFAYLYDDIGNRKSAISGGDSNGLHLRLQTYSANSLNQYTSRTVPGYVDVLGTATNAATVTVNGVRASRKNDYYRAEVGVPNSGPVWPTLTNTAALASGTNDYVTNWTGNVFVPATPESFTHDLDGNLTSDGRWTNRWDGENRLLSQTSHASGPSGSRYDIRHGYDSQSRRISKVVSNWTGSAWVKLYEQRFVYDGWNLLAILDENNAVQVSFAWGTDLSGSMQGAGGVGGLISLTVHSGAWAGTYFYAFDGSGNVAALISAYDGTVVARYEYDPFHRLLRANGPLAFTNPFVASTKFCDWETGLLYYGYRFYDSSTGRWQNRDPIHDLAFAKRMLRNEPVLKNTKTGDNLFSVLQNDLANKTDYLGLFNWFTHCCCSGKIISRAAVPTGIKFCGIRSDYGEYDHGWIEVDGVSAGFVAGESGIWGGTGEVRIPDDYADRPYKRCVEFELSPCAYDIRKLKLELMRAIWAQWAAPPSYHVLFSNCYHWRQYLYQKVLADHNGCGDSLPNYE